MKAYGCQSMVASLRRVIVKRPQQAFRSEALIDSQWKSLNYLGRPDWDRSADQHHKFSAVLKKQGAEVLFLPEDDRTGLDSLYTHDAGIVTEEGAIVFQTGKIARRGEGAALADALKSWDIPVLGTVDGGGFAEGGDLVWLDRKTLLAGLGFRTNAEGLRQLRSLLEPLNVKVLEFHLPYWSGPQDVLHLMSFVSLLDTDLAVVYPKLMPAVLFQLLSERGVRMVNVPDEEYDSLGCNVLALAPRVVLMAQGNPSTAALLRNAGCEVQEYEGDEISLKGSGGPTCLTRPVLRV
jgi:arginine deiminase